MGVAVSIIMPAFNSGEHVQNALESALRQSLQSIELLCVDDGSTDETPDILLRYHALDDRVRVIRQGNRGAGAARNLGLSEASGEFVAFLDSDDYYPESTCLEALYNLAKSRDASIAGGSLMFLEGGKEVPAKAGPIDYTFAEESIIRYAEFQQAYYYQRFIYSRDMLFDAHIAFPDYRRFQDVVFFVRAMLAADEFAAMPLPVYVYRKSEKYSSLSNAQINDMLQGYIDVLEMARDNGLDQIESFLCDRLCGSSRMREMVLESIRNNNDIARVRYDAICNLANDSRRDSWSPLALRKLINRLRVRVRI